MIASDGIRAAWAARRMPWCACLVCLASLVSLADVAGRSLRDASLLVLSA
ncbi:hypothetical protein [Nitratidesulfovibrio liaohensis]|uniref:Uncharacterized protein n=1 Tax=Nitratidesulfovibrio liaohensis TaxID=2604158 RepID=A0ABY9R1L9_9BACT|nr:hypothetical protein [Nitratidesulfovibrio liaohensis]WMW65646.1 hypothetical protein KPS_000136 [Nitratidesulfovibrio liaohensis]